MTPSMARSVDDLDGIVSAEHDLLAVLQLAVDLDSPSGEPLRRQRMSQDGHAQRAAQPLDTAHVVGMMVGEPDGRDLAAEPLAGGGQRLLETVQLRFGGSA